MSSEEETNARGDDTEGEAGEDDECPPPPEEEKEMLFLIEFLVDSMLLKPERMQVQGMDPCLLQGQTCVILTFLHYPPMCICEKDMDPNRQTGGNCIKFNCGKSLMFALSESQFENPPEINLEVCAYKMLPHGTFPNKLPIGMTKICLTELFKQVHEKVDEKPDKLPLSKSIKDKYSLMGTENKCPTAEITIYVRLSCLGQNIVTEFQRGGNQGDPFLFKSKESKNVYQCTPKDTPDEPPEDLAPPIPGWGLSGGKDCGGAGGGDNGGTAGGGHPENNAGPTMDDEDEFDEFGAEVHGHALTIKIKKSAKKTEQNGEHGLQQQQYGMPGAPSKANSGGEIAFRIPQSTSFCNKGKNPNKATVYSTGNSVQTQGVDHPDKDIFVLRIGKKGETAEKGKLELELRTPKAKIERPLDQPRMWDKAIQTEKEEKEGKGKKKKK